MLASKFRYYCILTLSILVAAPWQAQAIDKPQAECRECQPYANRVNEIGGEINDLAYKISSLEDAAGYLSVEEGKLSVLQDQRKLYAGVDDAKLDFEIKVTKQKISDLQEASKQAGRLKREKENLEGAQDFWKKKLADCEEQCKQERKKWPPLPPLAPTATCPPCHPVAADLDKVRNEIAKKSQEIEQLKAKKQRNEELIRKWEQEAGMKLHDYWLYEKNRASGDKTSQEQNQIAARLDETVYRVINELQEEQVALQKWLDECNAEKEALEKEKSRLQQKLSDCEKACQPAVTPSLPLTPQPASFTPLSAPVSGTSLSMTAPPEASTPKAEPAPAQRTDAPTATKPAQAPATPAPSTDNCPGCAPKTTGIKPLPVSSRPDGGLSKEQIETLPPARDNTAEMQKWASMTPEEQQRMLKEREKIMQGSGITDRPGIRDGAPAKGSGSVPGIAPEELKNIPIVPGPSNQALSPSCTFKAATPVIIGPREKYGYGEAQVAGDIGKAAFNLLGGLLGGGGRGGGKGGKDSSPISHSGPDQPSLASDPVSSKFDFSDLESGTAIKVGGMLRPDGKLLVSTFVDKASDKGVVNHLQLERLQQLPDGGCKLQAAEPVEWVFYEIWEDWWAKLRIQRFESVGGGPWKKTYDTGWRDWGSGSLLLESGVMRADQISRTAWGAMGADRAFGGPRSAGAIFDIGKPDADKNIVAERLIVHVTQPGKDPVTTVPFTLYPKHLPDGSMSFTDKLPQPQKPIPMHMRF